MATGLLYLQANGCCSELTFLQTQQLWKVKKCVFKNVAVKKFFSEWKVFFYF